MGKTNRCIVCNSAYRRAGLAIRERHNERKNMGYANTDIEPEHATRNISFKRCEGSYTEAFDQMVSCGEISTRGLKQDAKVIDEMVFDVNSSYFETHGGYDYAKEFFREAYHLAIKEAGGEQYILSAVMHADEKNKALSEQLGHSVYHYHLHVVYIPIVEKEVKWSKRCKDQNLVGTTKEIIKQVSHSKKWDSKKELDQDGSVIQDENGRAVLVNAYSLLQDRYYEHMKEAGFQDFERGERGSTVAHLNTLDYKIQRDKERLGKLKNVIESKTQQTAMLVKSVMQAEEQLAGLEKKLTVTEKVSGMYQELESMGKKTLLKKVELKPEEWKKLLTLAKSGLASQGILEEMKDQLVVAGRNASIYKTRWKELKEDTKDYYEAVRRQPEQTKAALEALKNLEQSAPGRNREQCRPSSER